MMRASPASSPWEPDRLLPKMWVFAGTAYPLWSFLAPAGSRDPLWVWCAIGAFYLGVGAALWARPRSPLPRWAYLPPFAVAVHLHALYALNPQHTFYAVAAVMAVFSSIPLLQDRLTIVAYSVVVIALSVLQVLTVRSSGVFLSTGIAWMLLLWNRYARAQAEAKAAAARALTETRAQLEHERSERQRLETELRTAQRMDALGRLAGAFAHEFNNQLMAIRIHADLLEKGMPAGAPELGDVQQIQNTTNAAADLTARLLTFSRPAREKEPPADVGMVVRQNAVTLRHLMTEVVPLAWSAPPLPCRAPVGAKQLSQVLLNLALNAREAMPNGGALRIDVTLKPRSSALLPDSLMGDTLVVLSVTDDGVGMDEETRERIFEPFFTTKAERGNSGLGLSVVYGIVRETGGHIRVTSERGQGARFDIFWPLVDAVPSVAPPAVEPRVRALRGRVLLVEDQTTLRVGLTRWLADSGFSVVACESAEEALARAKDIDVLASDVVLRGMDGIELVGRLRRAAPRIPAVLFSGHLDHLAKQRREIPDGVTFLEKPFAPELLVSKIGELVDESRSTSVH